VAQVKAGGWHRQQPKPTLYFFSSSEIFSGLEKEGEFVFNFSGESVVGLIEISGHQKSLSSPEEFSSGPMP